MLTQMISLFLGGTLAVPPQSASTPQGENDKRVYYVGTAHLDTQWLWTIQDTIRDHLRSTLHDNFKWLEKYPDYVFSFEGSFRYELFKEYYPEEYERMRKYIEAGRWRVTGSWVDAVDTNIPSPESLIRQTLYGNGYWKKEFGKSSVDIFLPDCFGFGYALPSIANHCGLKGFSTQKLGWGSSIGIPFPLGNWKGVDGSTVIAALNAGDYNHRIVKDAVSEPYEISRVTETGKKSGAWVDYRYHGRGDMGGAPHEVSVENLQKAIHEQGPLKILSVGGDQLFRDLSAEQVSKLPLYDGEILLTAHGTGCYSAQTAMKLWNRKNELLADSAERAATTAAWLGTASYPKNDLREAWVRFLWHQFHDDLTGTSIAQAYTFSWNDELLSLGKFADILQTSASAVAAHLDTSAKGLPVVVYNPAGFARKDLVTTPWSGKGTPRVVDPAGKEVKYQVSRGEVIFAAEVPANGWSVYHIETIDQPVKTLPGTTITRVGEGYELGSDRYRVKVNSAGDIASVFDLRLAKELLAGPSRLELRNDISKDWNAWEIPFDVLQGDPRGYVDGPAKMQVVEKGPVRVSLQVVREKDGSRFVQTISLAQGSSRVEVDNRVKWHSKGTLLKAVFPLAVSNDQATYDLGLGAIRRGNNTKVKYEVPAQQWADLTAKDGSSGVAILTESKYGWDKPNDNTLRLTLIHTGDGKGNWDFQNSNDLGNHHFTYAIQGHKGYWTNVVPEEAHAFNQPLVAFTTGHHAGSLGRRFQFVSVNNPAVAIKSVKKAEDTDEVIVRVFETSGADQPNVKLSLPGKVLSIREVNGQEEPVAPRGDVKRENTALRFGLKRYQPRAFAITLAGSKLGKSVTSVPMKLPFDQMVTTRQDGRDKADFDGQGHSYVAELWPTKLKSAEVNFTLGAANANNALTASGQTLPAPQGAKRIYLLAASSGPDTIAQFKVGANVIRREIPNYSGWIGQWDSRMVNGKVENDPNLLVPAFLKRTPVAWVGTHRHAKGGDDLYVFTYMFRIAIDVPKGVSWITLPNDPRIKIFAASAVMSQSPDVLPTRPLYE